MQSTLRFLKSEDGPTSVEYAVMISLILVACIASVNAMINATKQSFEASRDALNSVGI